MTAEQPEQLGGIRQALLLLALSVFAGVTTEMLPVGLLPEIGSSFGVTESTTGLLVGLYAALVAVLSVPLTLATGRVQRKRLLLAVIGCFAVSNLLASLAPSFAVLALARAIGGATHALFFSVCIGYGARLVPPSLTGRALALMSVGVSAGFVLGVPAATALGIAVGWRGAFGALAALMAATWVLVALRLPAMSATEGGRASSPGASGRMVAAVGANALTYLGQFTLYTYVTVLLLGAGAVPAAVSPVLLLFGACGLAGVWLAGPRIDVRFRRSAVVILLLLVAGILGVGSAYPLLVPVVLAGAVWNGALGPVASLYQSAAVRTGATTPDIAGAWVNATSNIGIGGGAVIGGLVLHAGGIRDVAWAAAVPVAAAVTIVLLARGTFPQRT